MKKVVYFFSVAAISSLLLQSCSNTLIRAPKYVSVDNVMDIRLNFTLEDVISKLGMKPYDVYSSHKEGYTIYIYKYKLVERKERPGIINAKGGEVSGSEVYNPKENTLYLMFKDARLESFVTSSGRKDSGSIIMLNNTLYTISQEKGKYSIIPTAIEEEKSGLPGLGLPALPIGGKKK